MLKGTKTIQMALSCMYKGDKSGNIEERKASSSLKGDLMVKHVHLDPFCTLETMVDRAVVRMIVGHNVHKYWHKEHFDIMSAFLNEKLKQVSQSSVNQGNG